MSMNCFITGTDTNVGKTYVTSRWVQKLRGAGIDCVAMKPLCCGERTDAELLHAACDQAADLNDINPVWFRAPAAPYTAALVENRAVDLALIFDAYRRLRARHASVLVEGAGGWRVPITRDYAISDLAREMGLPVAVVVSNRLGALNHALLTIDAIKASGLECAGIIWNHAAPPGPDDVVAQATNRAVLEEVSGVPVLFELQHGQETW